MHLVHSVDHLSSLSSEIYTIVPTELKLWSFKDAILTHSLSSTIIPHHNNNNCNYSDNDYFLTQASDLLGMIEGDLTPLQDIHSCNNTQSIIKVTISKHTHHYKSFSKYFDV